MVTSRELDTVHGLLEELGSGLAGGDCGADFSQETDSVAIEVVLRGSGRSVSLDQTDARLLAREMGMQTSSTSTSFGMLIIPISSASKSSVPSALIEISAQIIHDSRPW